MVLCHSLFLCVWVDGKVAERHFVLGCYRVKKGMQPDANLLWGNIL